MRPTAAASQTELPAGGTLRWAIQEPEGIVPPRAVESDGQLVTDALFDSLTRVEADGSVSPLAASSWQMDDRGQRWIFTLARDAVFHDGSPVTAGDFALSWNLAARALATGFHLRDVQGFDAVAAGEATQLEGLVVRGRRVLEVRLARPRADFASVVAHPTLGPVQASAWEADASGYQRRPIGNGPFRMAEPWAHEQFVRLVPAREQAAPDAVTEVLFRIVDPATAYVAFQQGRLDITTVPSGALQDALERYGTASLIERETGVVRLGQPSLSFLGFDTAQPPFDDGDVRRGVSLAIDRDLLAAAVREGNVSGARAVVPPALPGYQAGACEACVYDPDRAARLFARAGVSELTLWSSADGGNEALLDRLATDLRAVGVSLRVRQLPFERHLAALEAGRAGFYHFGWAAEYVTADDILVPLFHSAANPKEGGANYGRFADERVDALLDAARRTEARGDRGELLRRVERIVLSQQVIVPLFTAQHRLLVAPRVRALELDPFGRPRFAQIRLGPPSS